MPKVASISPTALPDRGLTLGQIVGQDGAVDFVRTALAEKSLPQSILFAGPPGVGKKSMLWALVREIVAEGEDAATHHGARKVARGTHPDIFVCDDSQSVSGQIVIDRIREADDWCATTPLEGPKKIVVITPAEGMNESAANALLKLLEEPPRHIVILLTCVEPTNLMTTIRSRCTPIALQPLGREALAAWLKGRAGAAEGRIELAARLAEGRPGQALSLLEGSLFEQRGAILGELELLKQYGFAAVFGVAERLGYLDSDPELTLRTLVVLLRDAVAVKLGTDAVINQDLTSELECLAEGVSAEGLLDAAEKVAGACGQLKGFYTPQSRAHFMEVLTTSIGRALRKRGDN